MSFYDAIRVGASGAADYEIERSLRFNDGDSANLTRTSSSTSTTFTYSAWIKRCHFSGYQYIFSLGNSGFAFHTTNNTFYLYDGTNLNESTARFRDTSAWYHIVVQINSGVATSYVNNVLVHNAVGSGFTFTTGTNETRIGSYNATYYFDGYQAEINLVDGSVVAPSSFTETDSDTGQLIPKKYTGSYGTNGFYLNFSDNSGTTATTLGKDNSGNSNNFTPNNFSVSAGAGNDSLEDTPTNNFCTFNPLKVNVSTPVTYSEGNLQYNGVSGNNHLRSSATISVSSGKWYVEFKMVSGYSSLDATIRIGIITSSAGHRASNNDALYYENTNNATSVNYGNNGTVYLVNTSQISGLTTYTNNDVMGIALDLDNDKFFVSKNGTFFTNGTGTQDPAAGTNPLYSGGVLTSRKSEGFEIVVSGYSDKVITADFGQQGFAYTPPTGFKAISTANLPDPTILLPNKYFDTLLYTGNNTDDRNITGLNFQPDWLWIKERSGTDNHLLFNSIVGTSNFLNSNNYNGQGNDPNALQSFNSDGFQIGTSSELNGNSETYVAWNWDAGETDGKTYTVTVVSDSGNKYRFDGFGTSAVTLDLAEGGTYIFNYPSAHPLKFSTTADGTHGGGSEYTTGVTHNTSTQVTIVVAASAPTLYYYCGSHSGMGGQVNTNSTLGSSNFDGTIQVKLKVNATAGFSIGTYSGNGSAGATIGHGLGVKPDAIIIKKKR